MSRLTGGVQLQPDWFQFLQCLVEATRTHNAANRLTNIGDAFGLLSHKSLCYERGQADNGAVPRYLTSGGAYGWPPVFLT